MNNDNITFVKTQHHYQTYDDYFRLAELAGFNIVYIEDIHPEDPDAIYIFTHFAARFYEAPIVRARMILWQLEWIVPDRYADEYRLPFEVWASDGWYCEQLRAAGIEARYVPFGSDRRLAQDHARGIITDTLYDVALMAYRDPHRRAEIINQLTTKGIRIAPNGWGRERHEALHHSRAMLHIHQHDGIATVAPQRFAIAAAYKLAVISETLSDRGIFDYRSVLTADYPRLVETVHVWTRRNDPRGLRDRGDWLHGLLCVEYPFQKCVEDAL
jgi:hypothetical protein